MAHLLPAQRFAAVAVGNHVQTPEQATALNVADQRVAAGEIAQTRFQVSARSIDIVQQAFVFDDVYDRVADRGRNRVAAEGIEVMVLSRIVVDDVACGRHQR